MDSSYTNSFGQFGDSVSSSNSGASNGVGPIMSAPSEPVVSGGGDVVLAPSGGVKKKRWPLVVGIVLILIAIGAGVGAWIASQPKGGSGGSGGVSSNTLKGKFNIYANYVLFGKDSAEDFGYDVIMDTTPYFMTEGIDVNNYVKTAQNKYDEFSTAYYENNGKQDIYAMAVYYQYYVEVQPLTMNNVVSSYANNGYDATVKMINEKYDGVTTGVNQEIDEFVFAERNLSKAWLKMAVEADGQGCFASGMIKEDCYLESEALKNEIINNSQEIIKIFQRVSSNASTVLMRVYNETYNGEVYES